MEVKCINWFECKGSERFLYLKARQRNGETVFIRFQYYFYYVVYNDVYLKLSPPAHKARSLGNMKIINIDEYISYDVDSIKNRKAFTKEIWLVEELKRRSIQNTLMTEFLNITWFFIANDIMPDYCYKLNTQYLSFIRNNCYHCSDPLLCFEQIDDKFDVPKSCLFFDIECHFDKKFPSVFTNAVSHISCCYSDLSGIEYRFTLVNIDMLSGVDLDHIREEGYTIIDSVNDMDYTSAFVFCSEIIMLQISKKLLELNFDYVVSFNGHNFDIRYLSNRLELLTNEKIIFRSPDRSEAVQLCIYERALSSHVGMRGMCNVTYHINNNNGTIFFDLYQFIQKSEKLDSYKLDYISKNVFYCTVKVKEINDDLYTFIGDNTTDVEGRSTTFANVLTTGNYININDTVYRIINKTINNDCFTITIKYNNILNYDEKVRLSFGKDDVNLSDMYQNYNLKTSIEMGDYCMHDACLCKYIWQYYGIEQKTDAGASTYILPQSMVFEYRASSLIKGPLLKLLLETKIILYRSEYKQQKLPYEGGKVFMPKQKMFSNNVLIFDYNSLYPNVCLFGNLSPETLVGVVVSNNILELEINIQEIKKKFPSPRYIVVHCEPRFKNLISEISIFDREIEGTIPRILRRFLTERAKYKKLLKSTNDCTEKAIYDSIQYTYKIVANSVYGLMGFKNSALYSYASAKSCTSIGRTMITYLNAILNGATISTKQLILPKPIVRPFLDEDNKEQNISTIDIDIQSENVLSLRSVYGDTDSVFLEVNSQDIELCMRIAKKLETIINESILFSNFRIEFEAIYKNLIMQSKKKYTTLKIASLSSVPERINKGTSETRRDVSKFHKEMIKKYKTRISEMLSNNITSYQVSMDILKSLEQELLLEFDNKSSLEMFMLSRTHHCNYKSMDNQNMMLVNKYNKENTEIIEIGERYFFAYICEKSKQWQRRLTNIKTYERIIDKSFKLKDDERIFYEVYFKRLATEIINLLDNRVLSTSFFEKMFGVRPVFVNHIA
ncbi:DNA polymerase [Cetacean poxvirus 1]|nr:DNA polymerase [Cetacean poxvirus 1]